MLEPNCQALHCRGSGCLSLQGFRLFKRCQILPGGHCVAGVQAVKAVSEPICQALCSRGAGCLSGFGSYLQALVCRGAGWLSGVGTSLRGTVGLGCRLFKWCWKLPPGHCGAGVQAV